MSMPSIPDITPKIELQAEDSVKVLLDAIAMQEMSLSHIVNAEGEKLQYIIATLQKDKELNNNLDLDKINATNDSINKILKNILKNQMILQIKMEDAMELYKFINEKDNTNQCSENNNCNDQYVMNLNSQTDKEIIYGTDSEIVDVNEEEVINDNIDDSAESTIDEEVNCRLINF